MRTYQENRKGQCIMEVRKCDFNKTLEDVRVRQEKMPLLDLLESFALLSA